MNTQSELKEKLVAINRITKVVKGGRRFGFAALVIVGNQKGLVGYGHGKAKQVPDAIKKASEEAKSSLVKVPLEKERQLNDLIVIYLTFLFFKKAAQLSAH